MLGHHALDDDVPADQDGDAGDPPADEAEDLAVPLGLLLGPHVVQAPGPDRAGGEQEEEEGQGPEGSHVDLLPAGFGRPAGGGLSGGAGGELLLSLTRLRAGVSGSLGGSASRERQRPEEATPASRTPVADAPGSPLTMPLPPSLPAGVRTAMSPPRRPVYCPRRPAPVRRRTAARRPDRGPHPGRRASRVQAPAGFDAQLVASEPDIQKPMQMAFDAKGRLWVTTSYHYPFAAAGGQGHRQAVRPLRLRPGRARREGADLRRRPEHPHRHPAAAGLQVVHRRPSVGEILKLTDTDGDGKADKTEVLFSRLRHPRHARHGQLVHADARRLGVRLPRLPQRLHGEGQGRPRGRRCSPGNTFRFRPDGSRIEVFTRGQVNPFGMCVDPWFNLYTADCHSKPITQLDPRGVLPELRQAARRARLRPAR